MQRFLNRLAWRNLSLTAKTGLLFLLQMALIAAMAALALTGQAAVREELRTGIAVSVEMRALAQDLQLNLQSVQRVEARLAEQRQGWAVFHLAGPSMSSEHDALTGQLLADAGRMESLAATILTPAEQVPLTLEARTIRTSAESSVQSFAAMLGLVEQLTRAESGALAMLEQQGERLEALSAEQGDAELVAQAGLMRNLARTLAETGAPADLAALREAGDAYLAIYQTNIPPGAHVRDIPPALEAYLAQAEQVARLLGQLEAAFSASQTSLGVGLDAASRLSTITEAQRQARLERIDAIQRSANRMALAGLAVTLALGGALTALFGRDLARAAQALLRVTRQLEAGDLAVRAPVQGEDEFSQLGAGFNAMADQLQGLVTGLEQRVAERTRDLSITAELGRAASSLREPRALMDELIELIRQRFGYYHAQVFLLDETGENANLVASTGTAGRELLARRHALAVGSQSVIGQVTARGEPIVASDTDASGIHRRNELLPDTRAEMALPMRVGERVIGALDVQSVAPDAFDEDVVAVFQIMADQLAIALDNARLQAALADTQAAMEAMERRLTREAWQAFQRARDPAAPLGYELRDDTLAPHAAEAPPPMQRALQSGQLVTADNGDGEIGLAVPIRVRGEVIGAFGFGGEALRGLSEEELGLVEAVADRVGLALENLRLAEEAARRAGQEQLLNEITAKIVGSTDVSYILQTTVRELGRVLRAPQTAVQLRPEGTGTGSDE